MLCVYKVCSNEDTSNINMSRYGIHANAHTMEVYNSTAMVHGSGNVTLVYVTLLYVALVHVTLVPVSFAGDQQVRTVATILWAHLKPSMHPPRAQATQGREKLQVVSTVVRCTVPPTPQLWCTRRWCT